MPSERGKRFACHLRHERVLAAVTSDNRLMKMPSGRHDVRNARPAHEGRVIAVTTGDLLHSAAKQDHRVSWNETDRRLECELRLAGTVLDFHRTERKAERG